MIKVFWLEPTNKYRHSLRVYAKTDEQCAAKPYGMSYHDARVELGVVEAPEHPVSYAAGDVDEGEEWKSDRISRDDSRWPRQCACGYAFIADDHWRVDYGKLYEARGGPHDGQLFTLRDAPAGAMWDATWYRDHGGDWMTGPDGLCLVVKLPNGSDWCVDQECSNCTRTQYGPGEYVGGDGEKRHADKMWLGRTHYCWVRHGDPRTGDIHVDKRGETCSAGAGSILSGNYHGFLRNGYLT